MPIEHLAPAVAKGPEKRLLLQPLSGMVGKGHLRGYSAACRRASKYLKIFTHMEILFLRHRALFDSCTRQDASSKGHPSRSPLGAPSRATSEGGAHLPQ